MKVIALYNTLPPVSHSLLITTLFTYLLNDHDKGRYQVDGWMTVRSA